MTKCIYCRAVKDDNEFTLEHIIPQFLGGAYVLDKFKTRTVCAKCNNNLGLFVDAGFEKNFLVLNHLRDTAYSLFDPNNPTGLPLRCMGPCDLTPPGIQEDEICETWLGPLGEQIYWIRPKDERLYWYMGGNPRTTKKAESRAYFLFSIRSEKDIMLSWLSFRDAFEGRRVKKLMCTSVDGANPADIGFSTPDEIDKARINYFNHECSKGQVRHHQLKMYTRFDLRFLAKISLGIAYALFGNKALATTYAEELYKALWHRDGDSDPKIRCSSLIHGQKAPLLNDMLGEKYGVSFVINRIKDAIYLNINIGSSLHWVMQCASCKNLYPEDLNAIGDGIAIITYRPLQKSVFLSLPDYIAHKAKNKINPEIEEINSKADKHADYFKNL